MSLYSLAVLAVALLISTATLFPSDTLTSPLAQDRAAVRELNFIGNSHSGTYYVAGNDTRITAKIDKVVQVTW